MAPTEPPDDRRFAEHPEDCLPTDLIPPIAPIVADAECKPVSVHSHSYRCNVPLPKKIYVTWGSGDGKRGYWPLSRPVNVWPPNANFNGVNSNTSTVVTADGAFPSLGLTFVLDEEVAKKYYSIIGSEADWEVSKGGNPMLTTFQSYEMRSLEADMYSLESVQYGTTLTCVTTTHLEGWGFVGGGLGGPATAVLECEDFLIDNIVYKQVIIGSVAVSCNIRILNSKGEDIAPLTIGAGDKFAYQITGEVIGEVVAGFIVDSYTPNPKLQVTNLVCLGVLPNTLVGIGSGAGTFVNRGGLSTLIGTPAYNETVAALDGMGWPGYGIGTFRATLFTDGTGLVTESSAENGLPIITGGPLIDGALWPPIASQVRFTVSSSN